MKFLVLLIINIRIEIQIEMSNRIGTDQKQDYYTKFG